jgi:hypothetical protein
MKHRILPTEVIQHEWSTNWSQLVQTRLHLHLGSIPPSLTSHCRISTINKWLVFLRSSFKGTMNRK